MIKIVSVSTIPNWRFGILIKLPMLAPSDLRSPPHAEIGLVEINSLTSTSCQDMTTATAPALGTNKFGGLELTT